MAKRRRLIPTAFDTDMGPPLEVKAFARPGLETGFAVGLAATAPPIARVAGDAAAQAALAEMSDAMARARAEGLMVLRLTLDTVEADHLVRDRIETDDAEMAHLMASIREHGQRMPIEVTELAPGRYGLISGWRRLKALSRLFAETAEPQFATVQALLRRPESASDAYIAMVEENEVRLGLSYYERARIAARAVDLGVFESEKQALQRLFSAASRARRSKIGSFLTLYRRLDAVLRFPAAIPERLGLALEKAIEAAPQRLPELEANLLASPAVTAAEEQERLARSVRGEKGSDTAKKGAEAAPPARQELRPGVYLDIVGGWMKPVLTLSGPAVGPDFREALERWLAGRG